MTKSRIADLLGCEHPLIAGPMFLVSDEVLVAAVSSAGAVGGMPSLNWRTSEGFREAVRKVKAATPKPFAVNLIVNKAAPRLKSDLDICVEERVPLVITSLGNPREVIERMHAVGGKVFCDVTTLEYAKKVQSLGADAVIAVSAGAGGHAGPTSPLVLIPHLRRHLRIPIVAAGGVAAGHQWLALEVLGAEGVQIGTRFIASREAKVHEDYKKAILSARPEDIVLTKKLSGVPASVIRTPYIDRIGTELGAVERFLHARPWTKKAMKAVRFYLGQLQLSKAVDRPTWKQVWSAGQGVGLIDDILPAGEIVRRLVREREAARRDLCEDQGSAG